MGFSCSLAYAHAASGRNNVEGCKEISLNEISKILDKTDITKVLSIDWQKISIEADPSSKYSGRFKLIAENNNANIHSIYTISKKKWCISGKNYKVFSVGQLQNSCFAVDDNNKIYPFYPLDTFPNCMSFDLIVKESLTGLYSDELFYILCLFYIENIAEQGYDFKILEKLDDIPLNKTSANWKKTITERMAEILHKPHIESSQNGHYLSFYVYSERDLSIVKWDFIIGYHGKFSANYQIIFNVVY